MPKSLVASVTGGLFCRNCDYKPILFKFLFFEFRPLFRFWFRFRFSAKNFKFSLFRFSRYSRGVPIFTLLLFKFLLASSNFHAFAFQVSAGKVQFSRFCFSSFCRQVPTSRFCFLSFCRQSPIFTLLLSDFPAITERYF